MTTSEAYYRGSGPCPTCDGPEEDIQLLRFIRGDIDTGIDYYECKCGKTFEMVPR